MLKYRSKIGSAINTSLFEKLKALSTKTRIPISKLLDEALILLFQKHEVSLSD